MLDVNTNLFFREYNTLEHEIPNSSFLELDVLTWLEKIAWTIIVVMIQMHFSLHIFSQNTSLCLTWHGYLLHWFGKICTEIIGSLWILQAKNTTWCSSQTFLANKRIHLETNHLDVIFWSQPPYIDNFMQYKLRWFDENIP